MNGQIGPRPPKRESGLICPDQRDDDRDIDHERECEPCEYFEHREAVRGAAPRYAVS
jgi:hypothetical protein